MNTKEQPEDKPHTSRTRDRGHESLPKEPSANRELSANREPSASKEPSAKEPSAKEPSANKKPSAENDPITQPVDPPYQPPDEPPSGDRVPAKAAVTRRARTQRTQSGSPPTDIDHQGEAPQTTTSGAKVIAFTDQQAARSGTVRSKTRRPPPVLTRMQVAGIIPALAKPQQRVGALILWLRLVACRSPWFACSRHHLGTRQLTVHNNRGFLKRIVVVPVQVELHLADQLGVIRKAYEQDFAMGEGGAPVPESHLDWHPDAETAFDWQFLFPARELSYSGESSELRRLPQPKSHFESAFRRAVKSNDDLPPRITAATLRHAFAVHALQRGVDVLSVRQKMGKTRLFHVEDEYSALAAQLSESPSPDSASQFQALDVLETHHTGPH